MVRGSIKRFTTIVKRMIARPMLGIPIMSIRVKIPSMIRPNTLLTHPMMKVEFCVNKITSIYPPGISSSQTKSISSYYNVLWNEIWFFQERDHILLLKKDYILVFSKKPKGPLLSLHAFLWLPIHNRNRKGYRDILCFSTEKGISDMFLWWRSLFFS